MEEIKYAAEAVLFAAGDAVALPKLAAALGVSEEETAKAVAALKEEYDSSKRGLAIIEIDGGYQLCSRKDYYKYIRELLGEQRNQALSNAAMETLAIIAYKQPITRARIEYIRGVNSDGCVNRLYERGLIEEAGRLDAPGRPILYVTTRQFLRCFGLSSPDELPPLPEEAKAENEPEETADGEG